MLTGHSRTQAPQVTQSQMLSSGTEVPAISGPSYVSSPSRAASAFGPSATRWSRTPMISSFGDSRLSVA